MTLKVDGEAYQVVHSFSRTRKVLDMHGVFVIVDLVDICNGEDVWEATSIGAREDERGILRSLAWSRAEDAEDGD